MAQEMAAPGLRRLPPYWYEYTTRAKTRWYGRQIVEVFTTEFRDRTKEYYIWAIHHGLCTVNGEKVAPTYLIQNDDLIVNRVHRHEPAVTTTPVKILHRDDAQGRIVVVKPGSIPVHSTGRYHFHTLVEMVKEQARISNLYPSNRLDRLTSGIMVCSTTRDAAVELGNDFNAGLVNKAYVCRVLGQFPSGVVDCREPILAVDRQSGLNIVHPQGKECRTLFQRLSYDAATDSSVLVCRPITGRTHQIRVHAQWLGHPICNDPLYNHPVWQSVDRDVLATAQPRFYERIGGETGNVEVERVLLALKGTRDDSEGWARWRDHVLYSELNRKLGYEDVDVPGPNGEPAQAPEGDVEPMGNLCEVCHTPLLADPRPEELYIYLHAVKYWTDTWVFQDDLPWWACEHWQTGALAESEPLPDLPLIAHHTGRDDFQLGKGGHQRRVHTQVPRQPRVCDMPVVQPAPPAGPWPPADTMPPVALDVQRGLEDAAQREVLQRMPRTLLTPTSPPLCSALHSGVVRLDAPWHRPALDWLAAGELPVAIGAGWEMAQARLPRAVLDDLFAERVALLSAKGPSATRSAGKAPSEEALLAWLDSVWDASDLARRRALSAWTHVAGAEAPRLWRVEVDRSSYVFPTLSTADLEAHLGARVQAWLGADWHAAPRSDAQLVIKVNLAPRYGVDEALQCGPRARQGNPSGTLWLQLQVPVHLPMSADAVRTQLQRARAHALGALLPLGGAERVGTLHTTEAPIRDGLAALLTSRGCSAEVVHGPAPPRSLGAALVEMPEKPRGEPHMVLFGLYEAELRLLAQALRPGARALMVTPEPKVLLRAVRELENEARREHHAHALRLEPFAWDAVASPVAPYEHAATRAEADEESRVRSGVRSFFFQGTFLVTLVQAPLFAAAP